jgi:hypothetical protein
MVRRDTDQGAASVSVWFRVGFGVDANLPRSGLLVMDTPVGAR